MINFIKRASVAVIFVPILIWVMLKGGAFLAGFVTLISGVMAYELRNMLKNKNIVIPSVVIPYIAFITFASAYNYSIFAYAAMILIFLLVLGKDVVNGSIENAMIRIGSLSLLIVYPGLFLASFFKLRNYPNGEYLVLLLLILIWITDTFAYLIGMTLGKHRGIFKVSPKKSLEGFIAGFLFALGSGFLAHYFFPDQITIKIVIAAAISAGLAGQFGDLIESTLKRDAGVKDSSSIIPGHGGVLDRFDSLVIASPVFYCIMELIK
jgi:phosphatidate cytidylyltransferase